VSLTTSRTFGAAGGIAMLAIATQAQAGQASRRATNATQRVENRRGSEQRTSREEKSRPPAPAVRSSAPPQANHDVRPSQDPRDARDPRVVSRDSYVSRSQAPVTVPQSRGNVQGYAVPRPAYHDSRPVYVAPVRPVYAPRYVVVAPRPAWRPFTRVYYAPIHVVHYYQPYYVFQPRFTFAFGLTIGRPVAYPVWYDPYPVYGYAIGPRYGGISFDMQPADAAVFIDGGYVGVVDDFSPSDAPLTLRAGLHHVEIQARGCQPMDFDITVVPGQVIPYRGALSYDR
jgi:hypothetical protein